MTIHYLYKQLSKIKNLYTFMDSKNILQQISMGEGSGRDTWGQGVNDSSEKKEALCRLVILCYKLNLEREA